MAEIFFREEGGGREGGGGNSPHTKLSPTLKRNSKFFGKHFPHFYMLTIQEEHIFNYFPC